MKLFDRFFRKSEWAKLSEFSADVQEDIAHLLALDSVSRSSIQNNLVRFRNLLENSAEPGLKLFADKLGENSLIDELYLALLRTGVGRSYEKIKWNKVSQSTVVNLIGILVMCEYRNSDLQTLENDIAKSGYSFSSNESRAQFLVLLAKSANLADYSLLKEFDSRYFSDFWFDARKFLLDDVQSNVIAEPTGLTPLAMERFLLHSKSRQEIYLLIADSLSKKSAATKSSNSPQASIVSSNPFDPEQHKKDHPLLYIPHPKVKDLIIQVQKDTLAFNKNLEISEYEARRIAGIRDDVPSVMLNMIFLYDSSVLAFCSTVAVMQRQESKFVGCGVWKAVTEDFQKSNISAFALMAGFRRNGSLSINGISPQGDAGASLDLISVVRKSANEFLKSNADIELKLKSLLQGTVIYRNLVSHPVYGKLLISHIESMFGRVADQIGMLSRGELLSWDQQKNLK